MKESIDRFLKNRTILCLLIIMALAFSLRTARCFLTNRSDKDSVTYLKIAKDFVRKDFKYAFELNPRFPPLYLLMMIGGEKAGIDAETTGLAVSVIAGSLLCLAAFIIGTKLFRDKRLGLLTALMTAVHPFLIRISADIMRESLFICTYMFSLAFSILGFSEDRFSWKWTLYWTASGISAGLAVMTRSEGFELVIVLAIWFTIEAILKIRKSGVKKFILLSVASSFIFIFFLLAVTLPVEYALEGSSSQWYVADKRITGYFKNFFKISEKEAFSIKGRE